jgi:hypothetical protein
MSPVLETYAMNVIEEGIRRSLLMSDVARMQLEDATEAATKQFRTIDWAPADGGEMFYGPLPDKIIDRLPVVEMRNAGLAQRAVQRLNTLMHRGTKTA